MKKQDFTISSAAAAQIASIIEADERSGLFFRITVNGGGCSGFQYEFKIDDDMQSGDIPFEKDGVEIILDEVSLDILQGSELDYITDLMGSYFKIKNPNAKSACGCGNSFSL